MSGGPLFVSFAAEALATVAERLAPMVEAMAITMEDGVKELITSSKPSGRLYRLPGTKSRGRARKRRRADPYGPLPTSNMYQASAPGEAPAEREALYRESWTHTPAVQVGTEVVASAYTARTTPDGKYLLGDILERGTRSRKAAAAAQGLSARKRRKLKRGTMAPRPHVGPALKMVQPKLRALVARLSK